VRARTSRPRGICSHASKPTKHRAVVIIRWPHQPTVLKPERVIIYSQLSHSAITARAHCAMRPYGIKRKKG